MWLGQNSVAGLRYASSHETGKIRRSFWLVYIRRLNVKNASAQSHKISKLEKF